MTFTVQKTFDQGPHVKMYGIFIFIFILKSNEDKNWYKQYRTSTLQIVCALNFGGF